MLKEKNNLLQGGNNLRCTLGKKTYLKRGGKDLSWKTVLRILEILVLFRIRGSVPLTNGSGSCCFRQ
jgi:hypothetical protein